MDDILSLGWWVTKSEARGKISSRREWLERVFYVKRYVFLVILMITLHNFCPHWVSKFWHNYAAELISWYTSALL